MEEKVLVTENDEVLGLMENSKHISMVCCTERFLYFYLIQKAKCYSKRCRKYHSPNQNGRMLVAPILEQNETYEEAQKKIKRRIGNRYEISEEKFYFIYKAQM